jgi:ankyrin repeat protein
MRYVQNTNKPNKEIIEYLLGLGNDGSSIDFKGNTTLFGAVLNPNITIELIKMVIEIGGVNVNQRNNEGWSILGTYACYVKPFDPEVVRYLLSIMEIQQITKKAELAVIKSEFMSIILEKSFADKF